MSIDRKKPILCRLLGHKWGWVSLQPGCACSCLRCRKYKNKDGFRKCVELDVYQSHVLDKCSAFIGTELEYEENELHISLNKREAYVVMKLLKGIEDGM